MSIKVFEERLFLLNTKNTSYLMCVDEIGLLRNIYWGKRIDRIEDFAELEPGIRHRSYSAIQHMSEECSSFGGLRYKETSMKVTFADGVRDFRYRVSKHTAEGDRLTIVLEDIHYSLRVYLNYRVYEEEDVIEKWREAENFGQENITLERFASAEYALAGTGFESINFNGNWGCEFHQRSEAVDSGKKVYESLYGLTGQTANPVFILHRQAGEDHGEVYYGALAYSGNFKTVVETVLNKYVNIITGISDTDFEWILKPGEKFEAPAVYSGYSANGFTDMSNTLSAFAQKHVMPARLAGEALPVLYNSWYSTHFDVFCDDQIKLAERAAELGVELFVVDDGWFEGRKNAAAGLGDWYADREKFPEGLSPLIKRVNELGMSFGLWVEPEMVNPDSNLYRNHPDWIYRYKTREVLMKRNQYMLDMTNPEVLEYLVDTLHTLLTEHNIAFVKWDMNRFISEMASEYQDPREYKSLWYKNTQGVYYIAKKLRELHPEVEIEACASGGGRIDYGAMRYFDEYWPSDNTDPLDRLFIQESYSLTYPIKYMRSWLTDDFKLNRRAVPLKFRMHVSMCGSLGIGSDLNSADEEKLAQIKGYVEDYKRVRTTVQFGRLYRLMSLRRDELHAVQYVHGDKSVLFVFSDHQRYGKKFHYVKLKGLEPSALYRYEVKGVERIKSGAYLTNAGIEIPLEGDYDSAMICFEKL